MRPEIRALIEIQQDQTFGRALFQDPCLSQNHFRIRKADQGFFLQDLNSRNGTKVNGVNLAGCQEVQLQDGDVIEAGKTRSIFMGNMLAVDHVGKVETPPYLEKRNQEHPNPIQLKKFDPIPMDVQSPVSMVRQQQSLLGAISPAFMIFLTASASSAAMAFRSDSISTSALLLSSSLLAGAFGLYGSLQYLISRQRENRRCVVQFQQYAAYLNGLDQQATEIVQERRQIREQEKKQLLSFAHTVWSAFPEEDWQFPMGFKREAAVLTKSGQVAYQQQDQPEMKARQVFLDRKYVHDQWVFLRRGDALSVPGLTESEMISIAAHWCWLCAAVNRRLAWIGDMPACFEQNPACWWKDMRLQFDHESEAIAFFQKHPEADGLIMARKNVQNLDPIATWILLQQQNDSVGTELFSTIYSEQADQISSGKLREVFLAWPVETVKEEMNWTSLLTKRAALYDQADLNLELGAGCRWDLKKEGPHALVAGTTGSGKSEGLLLLLTQLAWKNSSAFLQMILIDFKGGTSLISPLQDLPHLAGKCTNLDEQELNRLMAGLDRELERRQGILSAWVKKQKEEIPEIDAYNQYHSSHPLSHLLIVVDEFASMKQRAPEIMKHLQDIARLGRSLGVHLILATQKPSGVVDDQIWSNCASRLCFQTATRQDSREMLGDDKAADLRLPGSFWLQTPIQEVKGRTLSLRQDFQPLPFVVVQESPIKSPSLLETALGQIQQRQEKRNWIVCPFSEVESQEVCGMAVDEMNHFTPFNPNKNAEVQMITSEHLLSEVLQIWQQSEKTPMCVFGMTVQGMECRGLESIWGLEHVKENIRVVINSKDITHKKLEWFRSLPQVRLLLIHTSLQFSKTDLFRQIPTTVAFDEGERETLRHFGFGQKMMHYPKGKILQGSFQKTILFLKGKEDYHPLMPEFPTYSLCPTWQEAQNIPAYWMGMDLTSEELVFWQSKRLIILFALPVYKQMSVRLCQFWKWQDPLFQAGTLKDSHRVIAGNVEEMSAEQIALHCQERDILWIGEGLGQWAWKLRLPAATSQQNEGMYFHQGQWRRVDLVQVQERNDEDLDERCSVPNKISSVDRSTLSD